jgi:translation initiation factor 2B subunit (eIF-2B alpha/beta/delta family)
MSWEDILREIQRDRERGATALAWRALEAVAMSKSAIGRLLKLRPSMPLIAAAVRKAKASGVAAARRELKKATDKIVERAIDILPPGGRYRVFGTSGTVEAVLKAVGAKLTDEERADVALVGADALLPGGDFVAAKGTSDFVRSARVGRCGTFVVATELKRVKGDVPLERGFERVNGKMVHAALTEKGLVFPPLPAVPGVEPSWLDRGALNPHGGIGRCHPHHARQGDKT